MTRLFALVQRLRCGRSLAVEQLTDNGFFFSLREGFNGRAACDAFHEDVQVVVMAQRRIRQAKLTAQRIDVFYPVFFLSLSAHGCSPFLALRFRLRVVDVDPERIPCFDPCIYPVQQLSRLMHQRRTVQLFRHLDELRVSHALQKCDGVRLAEICHQGAGKPVAHYAEFQAAAFTCELGPVCAHIFLYFSGQPFVPVLQSRLPLFVLSLQVVDPPFLLHIQLCQREPAFPHLLQRSVHGRPIPKHRDFFNFRSCHMYPHPFSKIPPSAFSGLGTGPGPIGQGAALRPGHSPGCGIFRFTLASSTGAYFSPHDRRRTKAPTFVFYRSRGGLRPYVRHSWRIAFRFRLSSRQSASQPRRHGSALMSHRIPSKMMMPSNVPKKVDKFCVHMSHMAAASRKQHSAGL
nr:MAG TPA: hypothetical protein [Caudoviricetes sp.]